MYRSLLSRPLDMLSGPGLEMAPFETTVRRTSPEVLCDDMTALSFTKKLRKFSNSCCLLGPKPVVVRLTDRATRIYLVLKYLPIPRDCT